MDTSEILQLVSRSLHMLSAVILAGGLFFQRLALLPASLTESGAEPLLEATRRRWARLVMGSLFFLLVTGLYNAATVSIEYKLGVEYLALLGIKIVLALFAFFMVSVLSGKSSMADKVRQSELKWNTMTCVLLAIVICIASFLKVQPHVPKEQIQEEQRAAMFSDGIRPLTRSF